MLLCQSHYGFDYVNITYFVRLLTGASEVNPLPFIALVDSAGADPLKPEKKNIIFFCKNCEIGSFLYFTSFFVSSNNYIK